MSIWFRASQLENAQGVFSGEGGLFTAGRWNKLGRKVIYCSESISLATLEWLSHNGLSVSAFNYFRYSIEIPDDLAIKFSISQLPKEWNATPATYMTRKFAETHLFSQEKYLAMIVPSVMVPEEKNLIINPLHGAFGKIFSSVKNLGRHDAPSR